MVLSQVVMTQILRAAHDELGHNGSTRICMLTHRLDYWKGLKASINKHTKQGMACQKRNIQVVKYDQLHFSTPRLPMQFILMHLIGPFHPSSNGYYYTLTMICMLTGYMFWIPLEDQDCWQGGPGIHR